MNPSRVAHWLPTPESIEKMQNEISEKVMSSNLPESVKDQYADRGYDQVKPYNQNVQYIFHEYSLVVLWQSIIAASRALRNSDYANPEIKQELLTEILRSWEQLSKVLLVLAPILAVKGNAAYDGKGFNLLGDFGDTVEKRNNKIVCEIPNNVMFWFKNDLFSNKIGPLLVDQLSKETNELRKHELILLLVSERPRTWKKEVQNYMGSVAKNSFYLYDVVNYLTAQYQYSYASDVTLKDIVYLIKFGLARHQSHRFEPSRAMASMDFVGF
jgi:hypothetical protein